MEKLDYSDIGYVEIRYLEMKRQVSRIDEKIISLKTSLTSLVVALNKLSSLVGGTTINLGSTISSINNYRDVINDFANGQMDKYQKLNEEITDKIVKLSIALSQEQTGTMGSVKVMITDEFGNEIEKTHQQILSELEKQKKLINSTNDGSKLLSMLRFFEGTGKMDNDNYIVYTDSGGILTVGHGVTLKWNSDKFKKYGIDINSLQSGSALNKNIVDAIELDILNDKRNSVIETLTSNNISLTDYQIDALVMRSYNTGNISGFVDNYKLYGNSQALYDNYMRFPTTDVSGTYLKGLENRRLAEWELFSEGAYTYV